LDVPPAGFRQSPILPALDRAFCERFRLNKRDLEVSFNRIRKLAAWLDCRAARNIVAVSGRFFPAGLMIK
jgi:hypothetical protein